MPPVQVPTVDCPYQNFTDTGEVWQVLLTHNTERILVLPTISPSTIEYSPMDPTGTTLETAITETEYSPSLPMSSTHTTNQTERNFQNPNIGLGPGAIAGFFCTL